MKDILTLRMMVDPASRMWLAEITRCLRLLGEIIPRPVEIIDLIDRLPDRSGAFHCESAPTGRANERRLILEPCQALRDLVAAVRAREGLAQFVAEPRHDPAPPGSIDGSMLAAPVDGVSIEEMDE
jgi:hypothetical protein